MTIKSRWKLVVLLFCGGCLAQDSPPLGSVEELKEPCPNGPIAATACRRLQVTGPGLKPIAVEIRITEPAAGVPFRGTVVMGSGGNGAGFYAGQEGGRILVGEIAAMGFRVVDRSWNGGWTTAEGGLRKESSRYATFVKQASPEWASLCASIVPKGVMECTPACILGPPNAAQGGVCRQVSPDPTPQQLLDDSVVHPGAVLDYPKTKVYFLYGAHDCGEPVPIGLTYATKVTSQKTIEFVPHTPHPLFSTPEGREAIKRAIEQGTAASN